MGEISNRKSYNDDFKRDVVRQHVESHRNLAETAVQFGITPGMLHKWVKRFAAAPSRPEPADDADREDIRALRQEVQAIKEDVGELKKIMSRAFLTRFNNEE